MKFVPGRVLAGLGVAFTGFLALRALWWTDEVPFPLILVGAIVLYLLTTWLCIYWTRPAGEADPGLLITGGRGPGKLPRVAVTLALSTALIVPNAVWVGVGGGRTEQFATWTLGAIGALMSIVMVRRRPLAAWCGLAFLTASAFVWIGPLAALSQGLVGSIVWVLGAQLLLRSTDRAAADTAELGRLQRSASAWQATQEGRRRVRRVQVQRALAIAGPVLSRTIETAGMLNENERVQARIAEGALRDELRGPRLLDDAVRTALEVARRRGSAVTVLDEGALDQLSDDELAVIRSRLAETLIETTSERLYIRTSNDQRSAVTIVGRPHDNDDDVDLWEEIPHPTRS